MVDLPSSPETSSPRASKDYLFPNESIVIVDDSMEIILIFENFLINEGFRVFTANSAAEFYQILARENIALVLLDIGLPDRDGTEILTDIVQNHPNLGVIMLTGTTDLKVAMSCLRDGADDYLAKPVSLEEFNLAVQKTLQKRRLIIDNRNYQLQLERTNYRTNFLHQLNLKMNNAYLNSIELESVLHSILTGITAEDGLGFNRAFLLLYNDECSCLKGEIGIGPPSVEDAGRVWNEIKEKGLHLTDILENTKPSDIDKNSKINKIVKTLAVSVDDSSHILMQACNDRRSIFVENGKVDGKEVSFELLHSLQENTFIITPLYSPTTSLGVIIADNCITKNPILEEDINYLEIFASQASLAIEHSHLYQEMLDQIRALEEVTAELNKNKDLLIDAERYSALGHMSAQLAHSIRNPITSIGGIARLLAKRSTNEENAKFFEMMIFESGRIEDILDDLFNFVSNEQMEKEHQPLYPLIRKSIMLFYGEMKKQSILYHLELPNPDPVVFIDGKRIQQAFLHLIRNGIEAMSSGGLLTIRCENHGQEVKICIEDSGNGMSESDIKRAADPFYTTKTYGTGMGLTLVEKIITDHNGKFALSPGKNDGTVASILLPKQH